MRHKVTMVALTKYPDIWAAFHANAAQFVPDDIRKIVVVDGNLVTPDMATGWEMIKGPEIFSMAANHNVGWKAVDSDSDIYNSNDDISCWSRVLLRGIRTSATPNLESALSVPIRRLDCSAARFSRSLGRTCL